MRIALELAALATVAAAASAPRPVLEARRPRLHVARPAEALAERLRARRRQRALEAQLPGVVAALAAHLRAGRALAQAVSEAALDVPEPSRSALAAAAAELRLGASAEAALAQLGGGEDVRVLRAAVELQARAGGDLPALLDRLSTVLLDRAAERRAAQVATAQARYTGRMVSAMPLFGLLALRAVDRPGFGLVVGTPLGWASLAGALLLTVVGHVLISRIAAVDA